MKLANLTAQLAAAETELADFKLVPTQIKETSSLLRAVSQFEKAVLVAKLGRVWGG